MTHTLPTTSGFLDAVTRTDRIRITWFHTRHLYGEPDERQIWVLEALASMSDTPVISGLIEFEGTFVTEGTAVATRMITAAGFEPSANWAPAHQVGVWVLCSLRPAPRPQDDYE